MWSIARTELGMTREEFLRCTPREFDAFCQRLESRDRKQRFHAALICSVLAEIHRNPDKRYRPYVPHDFMGEPELPQSDEDQVLILTQMFGCGPGKPSQDNPRRPELRSKRA